MDDRIGAFVVLEAMRKYSIYAKKKKGNSFGCSLFWLGHKSGYCNETSSTLNVVDFDLSVATRNCIRTVCPL